MQHKQWSDLEKTKKKRRKRKKQTFANLFQPSCIFSTRWVRGNTLV
jgi:hypothetical protein